MPVNKITLFTLAASLLIIVILLLSAPFQTPESALRIGYAIERPYAYTNEQGELTGAYIETAKIIAEQVGTDDIEWVQLRFDKLLSSLQQGHIDLVGSGMFKTPGREKNVDFSIPFLKIRSAIIVDKTLAAALDNRRTEDPLIIAVQAGSVEATRLKQEQTVTSISALEVPYPHTGFNSLATGLSDGLYLTRPTLESLNRQHGNQYQIIPESELVGEFNKLGIAFVFNKNDDQLREEWNTAAENWVGSSAHIRLISRFGFDRQDLP